MDHAGDIGPYGFDDNPTTSEGDLADVFEQDLSGWGPDLSQVSSVHDLDDDAFLSACEYADPSAPSGPYSAAVTHAFDRPNQVTTQPHKTRKNWRPRCRRRGRGRPPEPAVMPPQQYAPLQSLCPPQPRNPSPPRRDSESSIRPCRHMLDAPARTGKTQPDARTTVTAVRNQLRERENRNTNLNDLGPGGGRGVRCCLLSLCLFDLTRLVRQCRYRGGQQSGSIGQSIHESMGHHGPWAKSASRRSRSRSRLSLSRSLVARSRLSAAILIQIQSISTEHSE